MNWGVKARHIHPHSRPHMLSNIDRRTRESRLLEATQASLTQHVGGQPSAAQQILIQRCARLQLFVEAMDKRAFEAGGMSERDSRMYLAWCNSLRRALAQLGMAEAPATKPKPETLTDYLAGKVAAE
jgi:hypothetical protein